MSVFEVPLSPQPQRFSVPLAGLTYNLKVRWCATAACWMLDIADAEGNPIVQGIAIITGADLLEQYAYLGIGGQLIAQTDHNVDAVPTFDNLGDIGHLYFVTA